ncbi:MarR family winged helix-turn-helix transcriptional regulator [Glutamicibacter sp. NPDC087344]|uniref:MarR family winged helix-turn-helix transcriptional regulator n=1 Tax=Glutamicibacter sp. NPDC087344 TaxID=3363994 RepID=UPI0037FDC16B
MEEHSHARLMQLLQDFGQASDRYVESTGNHYGPHRTDMHGLTILMKYEQAGTAPSPRDLSRELQLSSPATTAMLDRLDRLGYITRQRSEQDRRIVHIHLTQKAKIEAREMFRPLGSKMLELISTYDAPQIELLCEFLSQAVQAVDTARLIVVSENT